MTFLLKNALQERYEPTYTDICLMERIIKTSGLDWTIFWPPKLTDGKATTKYKKISGVPPDGI